MADNEHIILGRHLHRHINEEITIADGENQTHQQQWVWSDRLGVSGIIDAVEEREGQLIPIEYKKGKMAKHLNDHFQLCAAALCLEERTWRTITFGEIFYHANRRRQTVLFTPQLRQATEAAILAARSAVDRPMPLPIDKPKKCQSCSLIDICLPVEVKQLHLQQG